MNSILSGLFSNKRSVSDLQAGTDPSRAQRGGACSVQLLETYHEIRKETILEKFKKFFTRQKNLMNTHFVIFVFEVFSGTGSHKVIARMQYDPEGYLGGSNKIQIYCDCKDFIFRCAYELNQTGSLFRSKSTDLSLGPALSTAPKNGSLRSTACKHASAVLSYLSSNLSWLMNN